jgi:aminocarboxymuconate-semialdehyde decarboxylase
LLFAHESIMTKPTKRDCGKRLSRRRVLQTGLAAAAVGAIGASENALGISKNQTLENQGSSPATVPAVDIHCHYFPEAYLNVFNEDGKRVGAEYRMTEQGFYYKTPNSPNTAGPMATKFVDLKQRIADMDAQGVTVQALSLTAPMVYWGDADLDHKLAKAWNDAASAAHEAYPKRLVAFCTLPMLYPDRAIDELNRASKVAGVRGVYVGTNINGKDLSDPLFEPVWTRIEELDLPIFLHPLQPVGGDRLRKFYLSNFLGNPIDSTIAASHLIFGGVLDRHPTLRIGLPHGGGVLFSLIGRMDHGWKVRPEVKQLPKAPSAYLDRFYYDTITHSKQILEFVISMVGAERVMVGSDFCFDMGYEQPVKFLDQINLSSEQRRMILGGTAAKLLKL